MEIIIEKTADLYHGRLAVKLSLSPELKASLSPTAASALSSNESAGQLVFSCRSLFFLIDIEADELLDVGPKLAVYTSHALAKKDYRRLGFSEKSLVVAETKSWSEQKLMSILNDPSLLSRELKGLIKKAQPLSPASSGTPKNSR